MLYFLLFSFSISLALTLPLTSTPLILGIWIILLTFSYACLIALTSSTWFGLILFIIYISGMLVMFSYFAAITPNQQFKMSNLLYPFIFTFSLSTIYLKTTSTLPSSLSFSTASFYPNTSSTYMYTLHQMPTLFILASLLLLALIFVVKIVEHKKGPLRPFM